VLSSTAKVMTIGHVISGARDGAVCIVRTFDSR
jgi:hypothetical protein